MSPGILSIHAERNSWPGKALGVQNTRRKTIHNDLAVKAAYIKPVNPRYRGNPLIECLPETLEKEKMFDTFCSVPEITEEMLTRSQFVRAEMVDNLKDFRMPLKQHEIYTVEIDQMIKDGYVHRNPLGYGRPGFKHVREVKDQLTSQNFARLCGTGNEPDISTRFLIGVSGAGKTKTIKAIVSRYPEVIVHSEYEGDPFTRVQIPCLFITLPCPASIYSVCEQIFREVDRILGVNHYQPCRYSLKDVSRMVADIAILIEKYSIGILIFDEIQGLVSGTRDAQELKDLFLNASNTWQCPMMFIGTMKAQQLLGKNVRSTRRFLTDGYQIWDLMSRNDPDWKDTLEVLWNLQYTKTTTPLTGEIEETLYKYSQGDLAILVSLFRQVQKNIIIQGSDPDEKITPKIITRTALQDFEPFQDFLQAIEKRDTRRIIEYEDIIPDIEDYDLILSDRQDELEVKPLTKLVVNELRHNRERLESNLKQQLEASGMFDHLTLEDLETVIGEAITRHKSLDDISSIKREAFEKAIKLEEEKIVQEIERDCRNKRNQQSRERTRNSYLLNIFLKASENEQDVYGLLKQEGYTGFELGV